MSNELGNILMIATCETVYIEIKNIDDLIRMGQQISNEAYGILYGKPVKPNLRRDKIILILPNDKKNKRFTDYIECEHFHKSLDWCMLDKKQCPVLSGIRKIIKG